MIDLASYHMKYKPSVSLARFFNTKGYKKVHDYLRSKRLSDNQIAICIKPHRGQASAANVHKLVFIEYLRWADHDRYLNWVAGVLDK